MSDDRVFKLGLALAGGATRGAYSAGVMDFLLEALTAMETSPNGPPWRVDLQTLAGTSAGGITAAIATASLCTPYVPLSNKHTLSSPSPPSNNLYRVWVDEVDLQPLFDCSDLQPEPRAPKFAPRQVRSILNADFMRKQAVTALQAAHTDLPSPLFAQRLELYITTANLRGVPFAIPNFRSADARMSDLTLTRHRDWVGFTVDAATKRAGLEYLDLSASRTGEGAWERVRDAAQGTAALPLIFPLKRIRGLRDQYEGKLGRVSPAWPKEMGSEYEYDATDGALFRNMPLELVRASMEARDEGVFDGAAVETRGSMIMVHPAPETVGFEDTYAAGYKTFVEVLAECAIAVWSEASFQEEEVEEIVDVGNLSRWLIAPSRERRRKGEQVLGTGTLGGFGGIIGRDVREHDFRLGRRNCQKFLQSHFVIGEEEARGNRIFGEEGERWAQEGVEGRRVVPIVPLLGTAAEECPLPEWPSLGAERATVEREMHEGIQRRVEMVIESFAINLGFYKKGFRLGVNVAWNFVVDGLVGLATGQLMKIVKKQIKVALDQFP